MRESKKLVYEVILEPDENGGCVVICPSYQGCYSQGKTIDGFLGNAREAILQCIVEA